MKKIWLVFWQEYSKHVLRRRFLWNLFSVPLFALAMVFFTFLMFALKYNGAPVGVIDQAGIIQEKQLTEKSFGFVNAVEFRYFSDEAQARQALNADEIQGFYIIEPDYLKTGNIKAVERKPIGENADANFQDLLQKNVFAHLPPELSTRVLDGPSIDVLSMDGSRQASDQRVLNLILPIVMGIVLVILVNISGGYLLQTLAEEKENRTMEIVITSVSPQQLMAGKILADISIGLTQLFFWSFFVLLAFIVTRGMVPWVAEQRFDSSPFLLMLVILPAAFVMVGGMMATAGVMMTDTKEAQQAVGLFSMLLFLPMMLMNAIIASPNSPLSIFMSLFPFTSPVTLLIRSALTSMPGWQVALALALLYLTAFFMLWLAARALRVGMLQYGRKVSLREVFQRGAQ